MLFSATDAATRERLLLQLRLRQLLHAARALACIAHSPPPLIPHQFRQCDTTVAVVWSAVEHIGTRL